jgi:hypothetical protein
MCIDKEICNPLERVECRVQLLHRTHLIPILQHRRREHRHDECHWEAELDMIPSIIHPLGKIQPRLLPIIQRRVSTPRDLVVLQLPCCTETTEVTDISAEMQLRLGILFIQHPGELTGI